MTDPKLPPDGRSHDGGLPKVMKELIEFRSAGGGMAGPGLAGGVTPSLGGDVGSAKAPHHSWPSPRSMEYGLAVPAPTIPAPVPGDAPALGAAQPPLRAGRRPAVRVEVRRLSLIMELKLRKNDYKGGWAEMSPSQLLDLLKVEVQELEEAIAAGDPLDIAQECADIANYAMMIADNTEGI